MSLSHSQSLTNSVSLTSIPVYRSHINWLTLFPSFLSLSPSLTVTDSLNLSQFCLFLPPSHSHNHSFYLTFPSLSLPHFCLCLSLSNSLTLFPSPSPSVSVYLSRSHWLTHFPPLLSMSLSHIHLLTLFPGHWSLSPSLTFTDSHCFHQFCLCLPLS